MTTNFSLTSWRSFVKTLATAANAGLSCADKGAECRKIDCLVNAELVEHQNRRLSAQLQRLMRKIVTCKGAGDASGFRTAG